MANPADRTCAFCRGPTKVYTRWLGFVGVHRGDIISLYFCTRACLRHWWKVMKRYEP